MSYPEKRVVPSLVTEAPPPTEGVPERNQDGQMAQGLGGTQAASGGEPLQGQRGSSVLGPY